GFCCDIVFFFFSSRRRHTRSYGDWSSDVWSSDLVLRGHRVSQRNGVAVPGGGTAQVSFSLVERLEFALLPFDPSRERRQRHAEWHFRAAHVSDWHRRRTASRSRKACRYPHCYRRAL